MSVRTLLTRAAIIVGCASAFVGVAAPAAHAIPQSATATLECDPLAGTQWQTANWHIHLALDASAPYGYLFGIHADFNVGQNHYLLPGESLDVIEPGRDGLGSNLVIAADNFVLQKIGQTVCNPPVAESQLWCGAAAGDPAYITYGMSNPSPSTYNFIVHESNGLDVIKAVTATSVIVKEIIGTGITHVHGTIELNGTTLSGVNADVNCDAPATTTTTPPTTTPPTTTPPTTVPPTTAPPTTEPNASDPTTTTPSTTPATTVGKAGGSVDPTTSTTIAVSAHTAAADPTTVAAPTGQLPFTGSSSMPLGAFALVLVGAGSALAFGLRRRTTVR